MLITGKMCNFAPDNASLTGTGGVKTNIDGTPEAENTVCKDSRRERRLTDVTVL